MDTRRWAAAACACARRCAGQTRGMWDTRRRTDASVDRAVDDVACMIADPPRCAARDKCACAAEEILQMLCTVFNGEAEEWPYRDLEKSGQRRGGNPATSQTKNEEDLKMRAPLLRGEGNAHIGQYIALRNRGLQGVGCRLGTGLKSASKPRGGVERKATAALKGPHKACDLDSAGETGARWNARLVEPRVRLVKAVSSVPCTALDGASVIRKPSNRSDISRDAPYSDGRKVPGGRWHKQERRRAAEQAGGGRRAAGGGRRAAGGGRRRRATDGGSRARAGIGIKIWYLAKKSGIWVLQVIDSACKSAENWHGPMTLAGPTLFRSWTSPHHCPAASVMQPLKPRITEPARLTQIIYTYTEPDKQWLTINGDGDVPMSEPADAGDVPIGEPADAGDVGDNLAEVRYIDLSRHSELLEFKRLSAEVTIHEEKATFIVREEYKEFIKHALSHRSLFRCFVTGKSFGAQYFLMYLLGLGKSVFWVQDDSTYYFNKHGVQRLVDPKTVPTSFDFQRALRNSWVLIDVDQDPMPNTTYNLSPYVIWTSSPRDLRWRYFRKHFWPCERWFMKPWSAKEIMAAAMTWCGPVARFLFQGAPPQLRTSATTSAAPFLATRSPSKHSPALRVLSPSTPFSSSCRPLSKTMGHRLVRQNFYTEFLTPAVAEMTFALAENRMEQLQLHLSRAFDISSTRGVAGKLVEGLMHRSLRVACDFRTFSAVARWLRPLNFSVKLTSSNPKAIKNRASPVPPPTVAPSLLWTRWSRCRTGGSSSCRLL
ncbi:hypothetical protein GGX14DRAFT_606040 [Mycena pura]|uniref:Uncharacterized protein n=1 Tax=Mycena pura TaxID=153505 RepID=A0AAD6XY60_9AGAR|nr:hypothetical protein GGX14DRAFT_606040 [Mycena pura]